VNVRVPLSSALITDLEKKRFFIRFLFFTSMNGQGAYLGIDSIKIKIPSAIGTGHGSIRLLHPTHDDHHRPQMVHTREEFAKRPVNIRNIQVGSLSPAITSSTGDTNHPLANIISPSEHFGDIKPATKAGNYNNRYEYVSTFGREANDPYFVKHEGNIYEESDTSPELSLEPSGTFQQEIASAYLTTATATGGWFYNVSTFGTEARLTPAVASAHVPAYGKNYKLPDRTDLDTWIYRKFVGDDPVQLQKNKTRFVSRFSSPGDILDSSRGFYTTPHEVYAVHNALPWRNYYLRKHCHSMQAAHCGRFGVSSQVQFAKHQTQANEFFDAPNENSHGSTAIARITIKDNSLLPTSDVVHLKIFDAGGNAAAIKFTTASNNFTDNSNLLVKKEAAADDTLDNLRNAITTAFSTGSSGGIAGYYDEFLSKNGRERTIEPIIDDDTDGDNRDDQVLLQQGIPGSAGNQQIISVVSSSALVVSGFYGGKNATARVYETTTMGASSGDRTGTIHKEDYSITSGSASNTSDAVHRASAHKRHRNRGDKLFYGKNVNADATAGFATGDNVALGSQYDNGYVSHTIPRTNDQVAWIKAIAEVDQSHLEQLDQHSDTYSDIEDLLKSGKQVRYLGVDQSGTEVGE